MKTALFAFAASVLLAAPSWAGSRPYVLHNGRHFGGGGGGARNFAPPASRGGGNGFIRMSGGGASAFGARSVRASGFSGGGYYGGARSVGGPARSQSSFAYSGPLRFTHYVYRGGGVEPATGSSGGSTGSGGSSTQTPPPNFSKPGALIRTAGQLPKYEAASGGGTHAIDGGGFVASNPADSHDVGRSPGVAWGRPDTPPGANAGSVGGNNGAAYNGPPITINNNSTTQNGASNNTNGNQGGGKNGASFPLSF
ncbi:MAG: hypothetical protein KGM24_13555 [Elusimicrobia bacterium]|nr:hypothetical protein [Elusimicrobiota bacterium]